MNDCSLRCPTCPNKFNLVLADGPLDARILAIGEAPGKDEDRLGHPFSGQAGKEYNDNYLGLAGLHRSEIRQTNVMRCRPDQNKKPNKTEAEGCVHWHLPTELEQVKPEIVILLGATAVNTLCPEVDLESQHGIPFMGRIYEWYGWIVPMWHPASGLHNTTMMVPMLEDWENFGKWLGGEWMWGIDDLHQKRVYCLASSEHDIDEYFNNQGT